MPNASPEKTARTAPGISAAPILAATLALMLAACGSDQAEEELMRRVVIAEAAAARADAARIQAEKAVARIGNSEFAEEAEFTDDMDASEEEGSPDLAPDNQGFDNEIVAPPSADPAPTGRMPA